MRRRRERLDGGIFDIQNAPRLYVCARDCDVIMISGYTSIIQMVTTHYNEMR
jgi:hypothetical protein